MSSPVVYGMPPQRRKSANDLNSAKGKYSGRNLRSAPRAIKTVYQHDQKQSAQRNRNRPPKRYSSIHTQHIFGKRDQAPERIHETLLINHLVIRSAILRNRSLVW